MREEPRLGTTKMQFRKIEESVNEKQILGKNISHGYWKNGFDITRRSIWVRLFIFMDFALRDLGITREKIGKLFTMQILRQCKGY